MNPTLRNILAVVGGIVICLFINGGLISFSSSIIPLPEGVDPNDVESIKANLHLYQPKHFIMPLIAHALGSLVGAFFAAKVGVSKHLNLAMIVVVFHLAGGIAAVTMIPGPIWFAVTDLLLAYLPMGYLGWKLAGAK